MLLLRIKIGKCIYEIIIYVSISCFVTLLEKYNRKCNYNYQKNIIEFYITNGALHTHCIYIFYLELKKKNS